MFLTIEGIEGSGKTTQVGLLAEALAREGLTVRATREPGGTELGARIRGLLLEERVAVRPLSELFLILADRAEHVESVIRSALGRGEWVLSDRFSESTLAYQAYGRGLDLEVVRNLETAARSGVTPDLTFVLDCPVEVGLERTRLRRGSSVADRFESEDAGFHERVRRGFLELARRASSRIRIVDGEQPPGRVHADIITACRPLLARRQSGST